MKLPRDIRGEQLVNVLCRKCGYRRTGQVDSHVVLETDTPAPPAHRYSGHKSLRVGTLNAILRGVAAHKCVSKAAILKTL